jgi:hypothetical protein
VISVTLKSYIAYRNVHPSNDKMWIHKILGNEWFIYGYQKDRARGIDQSKPWYEERWGQSRLMWSKHCNKHRSKMRGALIYLLFLEKIKGVPKFARNWRETGVIERIPNPKILHSTLSLLFFIFLSSQYCQMEWKDYGVRHAVVLFAPSCPHVSTSCTERNNWSVNCSSEEQALIWKRSAQVPVLF